MPSSHVSSNFHLVFSTKERRPYIHIEWRNRLYEYVGGIIKGMGAMPLAIGGNEDHVHSLVSLKSKHRLDYFLRDVKAESSGWVRRTIDRRFEWQTGYGAFSVSATAIDNVKRYILNQEAHHRKKTFKEEYMELLKLSGIDYDERYLW